MAKADWVPPDNANPGDIYEQAVSDRKQGRLADALSKHIWFHENALEIDPSYAGVRLSYNLDEWSILAKEYPQAKSAFLEKVEQAKADVLEGSDCDSRSFHDFESMNGYLGVPQDTVELFMWLDEQRPEKAKRVFNLAFSELLADQRYQLLGKYIDPTKRLRSIKKMYNMSLEDSLDPKLGEEMKKYAEQYFTYNVGALVAILINTNKQQEAEQVVESSLGTLKSDEYESVIRSALNGAPPKKWP